MLALSQVELSFNAMMKLISDTLSNSFIISNNRNILPAVVVAEKGSIHLS
jgi:hypothetical protein